MSTGARVLHIFLIEGRRCNRGRTYQQENDGFHRHEFYQGARLNTAAAAAATKEDRKSTRLNSSHVEISYAVFCLKKKKKNRTKNTIRKKKKIRKLLSQNKKVRTLAIDINELFSVRVESALASQSLS